MTIENSKKNILFVNLLDFAIKLDKKTLFIEAQIENLERIKIDINNSNLKIETIFFKEKYPSLYQKIKNENFDEKDIYEFIDFLNQLTETKPDVDVIYLLLPKNNISASFLFWLGRKSYEINNMIKFYTIDTEIYNKHPVWIKPDKFNTLFKINTGYNSDLNSFRDIIVSNYYGKGDLELILENSIDDIEITDELFEEIRNFIKNDSSIAQEIDNAIIHFVLSKLKNEEEKDYNYDI